MTKEIVTVKDLANYLQCREIPGFRLGGGWRFQIDEIDSWCRRATVHRGGGGSARAAM
jgi:hypothetical protein